MKTPRFVVWVRSEDGTYWEDNGEGVMTEKSARRIESDLQREGYRARALPEGFDPNTKRPNQ